MRVIKYTTCRLIQFFSAIEVDDLSSQDGSNWQAKVKFQIGVTMSPDDDICVKLTQR